MLAPECAMHIAHWLTWGFGIILAKTPKAHPVNLKQVLDDLFAHANDLVSEDDCAEAIVIPLLKTLGHIDLGRKVTIPVPSGEKVIFRQADIVVRVGGKARMVVETKRLSHKLDEEDASQALAYAELLNCQYAVL